VSTEDVTGGAGDDLLTGDGGANTLDGGPGADRLAGAGGDDRLRSRDGTADAAVDCGGGAADTADADAAEALAGCERIAPAPAQPPVVSGEPRVGSVLAATEGEWRGTPTPGVTLQWSRCDAAGCTAIEGTDGATYEPTRADLGLTLGVRATAVNDVGTATADSEATAPVGLAPASPPGEPPPVSAPPATAPSPPPASPLAFLEGAPIVEIVPEAVREAPAAPARIRPAARLSTHRRVRATTVRRHGLPVTLRCSITCRARVTARPLVARIVTAGPAGVVVHLRMPAAARLPATLVVGVAVAGAPTIVRRVTVVR
jgi:RTX calcium-binding nonapeptide repeat (4 copies)